MTSLCSESSSAAEIRSPGRQMRPMNPPGDPRSFHRWSVWRPMDSLGFAENVSQWNWTDHSTDALISNIHGASVKCGPRFVHWTIFDWLHGLNRLLIGGLPRTETDHPTINHRCSVKRARILHFLQHWIQVLLWDKSRLDDYTFTTRVIQNTYPNFDLSLFLWVMNTYNANIGVAVFFPFFSLSRWKLISIFYFLPGRPGPVSTSQRHNTEIADTKWR